MFNALLESQQQQMQKNIILLTLLLSTAISRIIDITVPFKHFPQQQSWIYLDKMTFAPGACHVKITTSTTGVPLGHGTQAFIVAVPEQRWEVQKTKRCDSPMKMPISFHQIRVDGNTSTSALAFGVQDYQTFYFILKDCQKRLISEYNNSNLVLNVKLHLLNNDRQIGQQQDHWYILPFLIIAGTVICYYYMKEYRSIRDQNLDWSKMLMFMGTVTQVSSLFWKSLGYLLYVYSGYDHFIFHLIYLFLHSISQSALIALLCLIGFGWTLNFNYGKQFQIFIPVVACLGVMNIILTMITKIGNNYDMHHVFDNVGGFILVVYRIVIILVFLIGLISTYNKTKANLKSFIIKFGIFGFIYISSMPVVLFLANYCIQARYRHEFVFITIQVVKFIANAVLMYEGNSKYSQYHQVNFNNASFLPQEKGFK